jgi:Mce-associated membrane protein
MVSPSRRAPITTTEPYDARVREAREGPTVVLWVLVVVLAVACAVAGVQVAHTRDSRALSDAQQGRYAAALAAARAEATAYVNVSHTTAAADLARIAGGATGALKKRYASSTSGRYVRALRRNRTVTEGTVLWVGVVRVDPNGATVLVATQGTRTDRGTGGKPVTRDLRLRLELVPVGGRWLTSDIGLVD